MPVGAAGWRAAPFPPFSLRPTRPLPSLPCPSCFFFNPHPSTHTHRPRAPSHACMSPRRQPRGRVRLLLLLACVAAATTSFAFVLPCRPLRCTTTTTTTSNRRHLPSPPLASTAYMLDEDDAALMEPEIPPYTETDRKHMRRALQLAAQALGRTRPNPVVGCVVLDSAGDVVGEGFHPKAGEPHAEVFALREAGDKAKGGTAYVTLEPCNHTGKTPPCVDALLAAGVAKVVAGMVDPFPLVGGKGLERLKANGVEVVVGCEEGKCKELNRPFLHRVAHGTPLGFLPLSFHDHQFLRPSHDTLMLGDGAKTMTMVDAVVVDVDAQGLKALEELEAANDLQDAVVRVVLAPSLADVPAGHSVWKGHRGVRRMVMTPKAEAEESAALQALGVEVIEMGTDPLAVGTYLHDMGLLSALWLLCAEGAKAAVKAGVVQDLWIHVTLQEADELDGVDDPDWLGKQFGRPMKVAVMSCDALGTGACLMSLTVDDEHVMA